MLPVLEKQTPSHLQNRIWVNFKANFTDKHICFTFVFSSAVLRFPKRVIIGVGCERGTTRFSIEFILEDQVMQANQKSQNWIRYPPKSSVMFLTAARSRPWQACKQADK